MNTSDNDGHIFSEEDLRNIQELGFVLRKIIDRLVSEGKAKIVNGKVIFLEDDTDE